MRKYYYNKLLLVIIAIGFIVSLIISIQRCFIESENKQIDLAMDYRDVVSLANYEGLDIEEVLRRVKDSGITSLAIYDSTLEELSRAGKVFLFDGSDILASYEANILKDTTWMSMIRANKILPNRVYIIGSNEGNHQEVKEALIQRLGENRVETFENNYLSIIEVKAQFNSLIKMPLGLWRDEMDRATLGGFTIIARPQNFQKCSKDNVQYFFEKIRDYPISEIVFEGSEVLGNSNFIDLTAENMLQQNINLGLIEHFTQLQFYPQAGIWQLAQELGEDYIARLYAIPKDEQPKLKLQEAIKRWSTTDRERNIRINLLRNYEKPLPEMSLIETNLKYFREVAEVLKDDGFTLGRADTFEKYYPNLFLRILVILGIVAAGVLYLSLISKKLNRNLPAQLRIFILFSVISLILILSGLENEIRILAAFFAANLFPTFAMIYLVDNLRFKVIDKISVAQALLVSVIFLVFTSIISMIGAVYLSGALSDVSYFLEFKIYRGIKLTFILPLILVGVVFLQRFNILNNSRENTPITEQMKKLLDKPMNAKSFFGIVFVLGALFIMIIRSGHTSGLPISDIETKIRETLENFFYARPRSKEIFLGHPAFMIAALALLKNHKKSICFGLILTATIGQISMVETFAHMRTPFVMSLMRGIDGLILGAFIGMIAIVLLQFFQSQFNGKKE